MNDTLVSNKNNTDSIVEDDIYFEEINNNQLNNIVTDNIFKLFPNPLTKNITILSKKDINFTISIYDMHGKNVLSKQSNKIEMIDIENWEKGIYIVNIIYLNNYKSFKLIKQ